MENITWKQITDYPNYEVNQLGYVRNIKTNKVFHKQHTIALCNGKTCKNYTITRLVANAFIPIPKEFKDLKSTQLIVVSKYEKSKIVTDLYWTSKKVYQNLLCSQGRVPKSQLGKISDQSALSIPVHQFDSQGNYIKTWNCIPDLVRQFGYHQSNIWKCCHNQRNKAHGFIWSYNRYL